MKTKEQIYQFIAERSLCVVSTVNSEAHPESALVGFAQTSDLQIIFRTSVDSRKARNIIANQRISVVIGWDGPITVQYEGLVRQLEGDEADACAEVYLEKNSWARKTKDEPSLRYYSIEPRWVRYTDISVSPWDITELRLGDAGDSSALQ